jgi:acyl-CoA synthetase (AMP-forming)/AMP-acid ligase II/acyl carrier protein
MLKVSKLPQSISAGRSSDGVGGRWSGQSARTLLELLERRAERDPEYCAYTFRHDDGAVSTWTIGQLERRARAVGAMLQATCYPGDRVLLVYPPGLDFVGAFFGCVYAGVLPVPATYPKPRRPMPRLLAVGRDCDASLVLTTSQTLETLELPKTAPELEQLDWFATDTIPEERGDQWRHPHRGPDDLAFLQYTSGSTSEPKGVMVSHRNLLHNLAMIKRAFAMDRIHADGVDPVSVWWLPAYHDMGLIGGILGAVYQQGHLVLMSPTSFLKRPSSWLKSMSELRATISGAPNFAYEMCVNKATPEDLASLDLSHWRLAFCGAEPIRRHTLRRFAETFAPCGFREDAFYPCYGLAEATLLVSGGDGPGRLVVMGVDRAALADHRIEERTDVSDVSVQELVGCGAPWLGQEIAIVDPETHVPLPPHQVGEIWVHGPSVAKGYWNRPEETRQEFNACLAGDPSKVFMRTGDLGFINDGNLYITGRVKEMIIVRGRNLYPQDIELSATRAHPALASGAGAAFSAEVEGEERLVVVHEVDRQFRNGDFDEVFRCVRRAIVDEHELDPYAIVLIRQASLPRTTSGKIQRNLCRQQYLAGDLTVVANWANAIPGEAQATGDGADSFTVVSGRSPLPAAPEAPPPSAAPPTVPTPKPALELPARPLTASELDRLTERIEAWLMEWLIQRAGVAVDKADRDRPFAEFGLDSLTAVEFSRELEDWLHVELTPVIVWNYPTPATMARFLAERVGGVASAPEAPESPSSGSAEAEFDDLLQAVEAMSDNEAEAALGVLPHHVAG